MEERSSSGAEQGKRPVRAGRKLLGFDQATADGVDEILAKLNKLGEDINALPPGPEADAPTPAANNPAPTTDSKPPPEEGGGGQTLDDIIAGAPGGHISVPDTSFDVNG